MILPAEIVLRDEDQQECILAGRTPKEAVEYGVEHSTQAWTMKRDDEILGWGGYLDDGMLSASCQVWLLTTPAADRHKVTLLRVLRQVLNELFKTHVVVWCSVDPNYTRAMRLLEWLGFNLGPMQGDFRTMWIKRGGRA